MESGKLYLKQFRLLSNVKINIKLINSKTFIQRLFGLIPYKKLNDNEVMVIRRCKSIHTFFMRFSIDVIFTDKNGFILKLKKNLKPWCICLGTLRTKEVYEAKAGFIVKNALTKGDKIWDKVKM